MVDCLSYRFARILNVAARVCFALTIILTPLRWRINLWERPTFPVYGDYTDFLLYASDITLVYTLILWGCALILVPRRVRFGHALVWLPLAGLTAAGFVSTFGGQDPILSSYQALRLLLLFLFYLYIVNQIHTWSWVIFPVGLQLLLQAVIATGQSLLQHSLGLAAYGELLLDPQTPGISVVMADGLRFLRAYGLTDHPNILGGCLAFGLVLLLGVMMYGGSRLRWLAAVPFLPALLALVMTYSRSAWLGLLVGSSFLIGLELVLRRWAAVRRAVIVGLAGLIVIAPFVREHMQFFGARFNADGSFAQASFENQSIGERRLLILSGNQIFVEHSSIGIGLGASPLAMRSRFPQFETNYQPPHLTPLAAAIETGTIGASFYLLLLTAPGVVFGQKWRALVAVPHIVPVFALLLTLTAVGLFDYYTWLNAAGRIWQWLAWGLWSASLARAA